LHGNQSKDHPSPTLVMHPLADTRILRDERSLTLADARIDDQPLVPVSAAFCLLSGYGVAEVVGRNCRFL
jgi:hypothetical protein